MLPGLLLKNADEKLNPLAFLNMIKQEDCYAELVLEFSKKPEEFNVANIFPYWLAILRAQQFITDDNRLTSEFRDHVLAHEVQYFTAQLEIIIVDKNNLQELIKKVKDPKHFILDETNEFKKRRYLDKFGNINPILARVIKENIIDKSYVSSPPLLKFKSKSYIGCPVGRDTCLDRSPAESRSTLSNSGGCTSPFEKLSLSHTYKHPMSTPDVREHIKRPRSQSFNSLFMPSQVETLIKRLEKVAAIDKKYINDLGIKCDHPEYELVGDIAQVLLCYDLIDKNGHPTSEVIDFFKSKVGALKLI